MFFGVLDERVYQSCFQQVQGTVARRSEDARYEVSDNAQSLHAAMQTGLDIVHAHHLELVLTQRKLQHHLELVLTQSKLQHHQR